MSNLDSIYAELLAYSEAQISSERLKTATKLFGTSMPGALAKEVAQRESSKGFRGSLPRYFRNRFTDQSDKQKSKLFGARAAESGQTPEQRMALLSERKAQRVAAKTRPSSEELQHLTRDQQARAFAEPQNSSVPGIMMRKYRRSDPARTSPGASNAAETTGVQPNQPPSSLGMSPFMQAGLMTAGAGALGGGAYMLGKNTGEENKKLHRNIAFGSGMATGLAAPTLLSHVNQYVNTLQGGQPGYGPEQGY